MKEGEEKKNNQEIVETARERPKKQRSQQLGESWGKK